MSEQPPIYGPKRGRKPLSTAVARITIRVPVWQRDSLRQLAEMRGQSLSEYLRDLVNSVPLIV